MNENNDAYKVTWLVRRLFRAMAQHKRSVLLGLSDRGRGTFASIRRQEGDLLEDLFSNVEIADIATTKRTLESLLDRLTGESHHA